jgi:carbon storage regulator
MLILSRKINEEILIGSTIRVIVLKVNGQKVKLGLAAPPGVAIHRKEIVDGEHVVTSTLFHEEP